MTDWPTGAVHRFAFNGYYSLEKVIAVTSPPGFYGGVCLTSLAAGADAVWVTLAPSAGDTWSWPAAALADFASARPQSLLSAGGHAPRVWSSSERRAS